MDIGVNVCVILDIVSKHVTWISNVTDSLLHVIVELLTSDGSAFSIRVGVLKDLHPVGPSVGQLFGSTKTPDCLLVISVKTLTNDGSALSVRVGLLKDLKTVGPAVDLVMLKIAVDLVMLNTSCQCGSDASSSR